MWEAQNEHLMPSNNYLTLYSDNTPIPNLGDTFSAVGPAQEQLLEVYAHRPDASFLAPNTATLGATGPHDLSEAPTSLFPASENYELFHFGTATQTHSNVQFDFNLSLDYASMPRTVPPLDHRWIAAANANVPAASSSSLPFHTAPQPKPLEELSNKRKRNPVDNDHPPSHKKTEDVPSR